MPEDRPGTPSCPARRDVLALGGRFTALAMASVSLAACGIRFEDDASPGAGGPSRRPVAGEVFLLTLRRHSLELATQAAALRGPAKGLPARLAALHTRQAEVLRTELVRLGVPASVVDGHASSPSPDATSTSTSTSTPSTTSPARTGGPSATGSPTGTAAATGPLALAASEAGDLGPAAVAALAGVPAEVLPLAGSLLAQRAAAATLLGTPAPWPEPAWSEPSLAASYLQSTRAAVYAFQVVAAQSRSGAQATLARRTLTVLEARQGRQEALAGSAAAPPPLAYPLPFPVTTPAAARRLAAHVLTELLGAGARDLGSTGAEAGPLGSVVQWLADTEVLASRWGLALAPFPGLT
jgi:hypothetical protein